MEPLAQKIMIRQRLMWHGWVWVWLCCWLDLRAQPMPTYAKADSVAAVYAGHSLDHLPLLAYRLTGSLATSKEKYRAIYVWVCRNIENDYPAFLRNRRQRAKHKNQPKALEAWNRKFSEDVFTTLRTKRKTVCTGYAYLMQSLAQLAGIRCVIIHGYAITALSPRAGEPNHSWNAVYLEGRWYLTDATWGSGAVDVRTGTFIPRFSDQYFLADPEEFAIRHQPLDSAWMRLQ